MTQSPPYAPLLRDRIPETMQCSRAQLVALHDEVGAILSRFRDATGLEVHVKASASHGRSVSVRLSTSVLLDSRYRSSPLRDDSSASSSSGTS